MATFAAPPPQTRDWRELPDAKTIDTGTKRLVVFLDYDGTLTPIVEASDAAVLAAPMRAAIARLAQHAPVAVVSGRAREKVREFVAVENLYYAGSHGFDIEDLAGSGSRSRPRRCRSSGRRGLSSRCGCATSQAVWKSTSASGAPENSSLSHFSAMTRPSWLRRAVRNRHRDAIEQASRRWRGGRRDDSTRTLRKI